MAYKCEICGKGPRAGKSVSHSNKATNRYFRPNLFRRKVYLEGAPSRVYVCSICVKSGRAKFQPA
ncbi:MAG: 50S ribosomal protein L28 [Elusimicrobia bacterium]|nr:50S ribosomal protein L28 [Elusimicrobiota bacterium]